MILLDTHVVVWLYAGDVERLSERAVQLIEAEELAVSPMVALELQYLRESKRVKVDPCLVLDRLRADIGLYMDRTGFEALILEALTQKWTRDPFDRIIAAHAIVAGVPLVTKDATILKHCPVAVW